jgi:hypothetical protein
MQTYRLYFHGSSGHIAEALPFECGNDGEAIRFAHEKVDHRPAELWQQARKVMDFPPRYRTRTG